MTSRIFVVRHGNTFLPSEPPRRIGRATDLPLVPSGLKQTAALSRWFADEGVRFDRALAGPLQRTRQTATVILSADDVAPRLDTAEWLAEIDHGPDENQSEAAVLARIGADALAAWDTRAIPPVGWTIDAETRLAAWHTLYLAPPAGNTLLVTSNGAARFALLALGNQPAMMKLRTGAYGIIAAPHNAPAHLVAWDVRPG